jgi:hypothetical protein
MANFRPFRYLGRIVGPIVWLKRGHAGYQTPWMEPTRVLDVCLRRYQSASLVRPPCSWAIREGRVTLFHFIKDMFLDGDTDMMVLPFAPSRRDSEPLTIQEADRVRQLIEEMERQHRFLWHGRVNSNQPVDLEGMDELVQR